MKKYLKWYLLAFMALAVVFVSAQPWNWVGANADETIPITITKVWDDMNDADGSRPESITMQVNQNGTPWRTVELTAADGSGNQWTKEITDAPLRDAAGNKYEYTLTEELPDGYESRIQTTVPEDNTRFTVEIVPTEEHPYVGDEFRYAITVDNDSTYDGLLNVTATLDDKVDASTATDGGTINGSTVEWTGIVIPSDGTKVLYITASASEEGELEAQVQASIYGHSVTASHIHDAQYIPELNVFRMEISGAPDSVIAGENATVSWKVTVRGDEGAEYRVSLANDDVKVVSGELSGTIGKSNQADIVLSQTKATTSGRGSVNFACDVGLMARGKTKIMNGLQTTVSGSKTVTVTEPEPEMLTVTWVDEDGITVLDGPKQFEKGNTVPSTDVVPTKAEDNDNTYSFKEWIRSEDKDGNIVFKASYTATAKPSGPVNYTVKWYDENGSLIRQESRTGMIGEMAKATEADKAMANNVFLESRSTTSAELTKDGGMLELYFMDYVEITPNIDNGSVLSDGRLKLECSVKFKNISGVDVYGLRVTDTMEPLDGVIFTFGDYAVDGTSITPLSGGANDLIHELKLLSDDTIFRSEETVTLTYTLIIDGENGEPNSKLSATSYESPRTARARMMRMAPMAMTVSNEREPIRFLVTNSHTPVAQEETTSVTLTIDWNDEGNEDKRPESVDVYLLQDENTLKTVTLNTENNWTITEDGLPLYYPNGYEHMYSARQVETPDGYKANITKNGSVITITNTYEAEMPVEYTVTYDLNGGTIAAPATGFTYSNGTYSKTVQANEQRPDLGQEPTKEHYVFKGWSPALSDTVTGNQTYKAIWEAESYTVTYKDGVDGSVFSDYAVDAAYGNPTPDYPGVPEREGYIFKGWNPDVAGVVSGDAVYTARWEEKSPDVHVHTKGSETTIKEPTCTETGTKASICSECGETYGEYTVQALGHTRGEEVITKQATCTETGMKSYTCGRCGKIYDEEVIPAMGHTSNLNYTDKGDGTHAGTCNRCDTEITTEAHSFGDWTESGDKMQRECTVCGAREERGKDPVTKTYTVTYSMNGAISTKMYEEGTSILVEEGIDTKDGHFAGWTWNGTEYHAGDTVVVNSDITFTLKVDAHTFEDRSQAGTCKETGYSWKECTVCGYETDRTETGLGDHQVPDVWTDGCISHTDEHCEKHVKTCMLCNKPVDSEDHSYGEWATKTEGGYTVIERVCSCGHRQAVKAQSSVTASYNGKERPLTKTSNYEGIQANIHGIDVEITYKDNNGSAMSSDPKNAGKYTAVADVRANGENIGSVEIAYEIEPAVLVAKYKGETIPVNGSFKGTVEVDGFMHDDTDMPDFEFPDIDVNGIDWSKPGTYTIKPYGGKVNDNYVFEYVEGTLTIVENNSTSVTYPGLEEDPTKPLTQKVDMLNNGTKVIVDLDGGKWEPEDSFWKEVSGKYEYTLQKNDMATLYDNPTKDGNLFMGWKKTTNGDIVTYTAHWGEISAKTAGDMTYNGMTQEPNVTVTIHGTEIRTDQFEITDYRDKDGNSLGTNVQNDPAIPKDAGIYTAEIAVKDALGAPVCVVNVEFTIKPAKLTVKTESANKEYDGKELTAGGSIEGFVNGEKATLKMTGTQTEKGSSKNTYEIEWGDVKASNYEITEELGTLTVGTENLADENTVEIKASINWMDVRDYDSLRPKELDIDLYQDGKKYLTGTVNGDSDWTYTFRVDKANENGKAHEYTVSVKEPKGYEAKVDGYNVTLTHVPVTSVEIKVVWSDKNNKDKVRPTETELVIYQNDKAYRTVKVTQKDSWKLSVKDLPKFDDDYELYKYSLGYDELPDGYTATIKDLSVTYTHEVKATSQTTTKPNSTTKPSSTTKPNSSTSKPSSTTKPNSSTSKPNSTTKPNSTVSGNSVDKDKGETVKTGENDFLLFSLLGLTALAGAGFVIYRKKRTDA